MISYEKNLKLFKENYFNNLDKHLAEFITRNERNDNNNYYLELAVLNLSRLTRMGHICMDLENTEDDYPDSITSDDKISYPSKEKWEKILLEKDSVGKPGSFKPLIIENGRIYFQRYWLYENNIVERIHFFQEQNVEKIDYSKLKEGIKLLFGENSDRPNWQKIAAVNSVIKRLSIITGGPGTGKTTTVLKILLLILDQDEKNNFSIAICSPTGKAATHLQKSIIKTLSYMEEEFPEYMKKHIDKIPMESFTIHRLLKNKIGTPYFKYNENNYLPYNLIIMDETSMVAQPLMSKFLSAISPGSRLIFLGDKDQLASVEAGSVLGDICDSGGVPLLSDNQSKIIKDLSGETIPGDFIGKGRGLQDNIVFFTKSHRFNEKSGIGNLSRLVNEGRGEESFNLITSKEYTDINWVDINFTTLKDNIKMILFENDQNLTVLAGLLNKAGGSDIAGLFKYLKSFQLLSPLRKGPVGVIELNRVVEEILAEEKVIKPGKGDYHGRVIIVTENDYNLNIFNGDTGIILRDKDSGKLSAYFEDNSEEASFKKINPRQIKGYDSAFAITVHKSQGSEYNNVLMILPEKTSKVLTKELIYTAITRARETVTIIGSKDIFIESCGKKIYRASGLGKKIWNQ